jgi:hypothetical protein
MTTSDFAVPAAVPPGMLASPIDVLAAILEERDYQDTHKHANGPGSAEMKTATGTLLLLEEYIAIAKHAILYPRDAPEPVMSVMRKITAIGFRSMQVNGVVARL